MIPSEKSNEEKSEKTFRGILNSIEEAIYFLDKQGTFLDVNDGAAKMYGYSQAELIGKNPLLVSAEGRNNISVVGDKISLAFKGFPQEFEFWGKRKNGQIFPKQVRLYKGTYYEEDVVIAVAQDITEKKQEEERRKKQFENIKHLFDLSNSVNQAESLEQIYSKALDSILIAMNIDKAALLLYDEHKVMKFVAWKNLSDGYRKSVEGHSPWHPDTKNPETILIKNVNQSPDLNPLLTALQNEGISSLAFLPLVNQGVLIGKVMIYFNSEHEFTEDEINLLETFGSSIAMAIYQKNTLEALKQSEEKYHGLFTLLRLMSDTMPDLLWAKDLDNQYIFANEAMCKVLLQAKDTSEPIGKTDLFFAQRERDAHPEDPEYHTFGELCANTDEVTRKAMKQMQFDEYGNVKGKFLYLDVHKAPMFNDLGELIGVVGTARDITARKDMENELRESEKKFNAIFNNNPNPTHLVNTNYEIIGTNFTMLELKELKRSEILGKKCYSTYKNNKEICENCIVRNVFKEKTNFKSENQLTLPDGSINYFETYAYPIFDEQNNVLFAVETTIDITDKKRTERLLKASEERYSRLSSLTYEGIIIHDNGVILDVNKAMENMSGYSMEELVGKNAIQLIIPAKYHNTLYHNIQNEVTLPFELEGITKEGTAVPIEIESRNIHNGENGQSFRVSAIRNITEKKKMIDDLIAAKEQALESDRLKSAFLANMSHEIRTPMNGILGFAELLKDADLTGKQQQEYVGIIEGAGARMLNIINQIIDLSRIQSGLVTASFIKTNINEKIEYVYTFFKPEVAAKGLKFSFKTALPVSEANILTDPEKIYALLINIVKNAIKYTSKGAIEFGYEVVHMGNKPFVQFFVKDTGIGIAKDRQEAVFERFVQADIEDRMAYQGAGLGLAISKSYVEMLGGKIWVESMKGVGSTFYFTIPYNTGPKEKIISKKTISTDGATNNANPIDSVLKILIAEDDKASETLLKIMVSVFGTNILTAQTGREAIEICRNNPDIDLILMDIQMPEMNGYKATQLIRQFNKEVVIVAQTAYGLAGDREKSIEAGCNDYISKPINKSELLAIIHKHFIR